MTQRFNFTFLMVIIGSVLAACSGPKVKNVISAEEIAQIEITYLPEQIDRECRNGRAKIYDECSAQMDLFAEAQRRAKADNKVTLVSYGAEWCIWCHVFDAYVHGYVDKFTYTYGAEGEDERVTHTMRERAKRDVSQEAYDLKKYVSENFILVHIDYEHSPDGDDVLSQADAWDDYVNFIPYIFTVNTDGKYAAAFNHDDAEVRRDTYDWYRGYDRVQLLEQLRGMRDAATR